MKSKKFDITDSVYLDEIKIQITRLGKLEDQLADLNTRLIDLANFVHNNLAYDIETLRRERDDKRQVQLAADLEQLEAFRKVANQAK